MKKLISRKYIIFYLLTVILFYFIFNSIESYYLDPKASCNHPIDVHVKKCHKYFDSEYVRCAKGEGYKINHYYESFFIVDLIFPAVYTLGFLSIVQLFRRCKAYNYVKYLNVVIVVGMMLDYLENFSFAIYLKSNIDLAPLVAFATTIKTILFIFNIVAAGACLLAAGVLYLRGRVNGSGYPC